MLENMFTTVFSMSITASVVAAFIISFRLIFRNKLPAIFSYALWAIVLLRLLIPFSITSTLSIFNIIPTPESSVTQSTQYNKTGNDISHDPRYEGIAQEKTDSNALNRGTSNSFPVKAGKELVDPMQVLLLVFSCLWSAGAAVLFSFSIFAYFRSSHRLREAVLYKHNDLISECSKKLKLRRKVQIYTSDKIHTPVVCGLIKARIILPLSLIQGYSELELKSIITHELVHIKRFDNILKLLSVAALCLHWLNPVIWVSFILSQKDMEMSCDEKVISVCDNDIRREYAASLIKLAAKQNVLLNGGLLAFGESNIKSRVKGIMKFKKPGFWIGTSSTIILIAIGAVLLTNGQYNEAGKEGSIAAGDSRQLEAAVEEYYLSTQPGNKGVLKIYNIKKYDSGYLVLTEKYGGDGEAFSDLVSIDNSFKITAVSSGNMPISPCFSSNVIVDKEKSIVFGNFKNKKWKPETDTVVNVQIDAVKITFEDGTVSKEPVSMDNGYIIIVKTASKIKNIEVFNRDGVLQSNLSETFLTEYSFRRVESKSESQGSGNAYIPMPISTEENKSVQKDKIELTDAFNKNTISPTVTNKMKEKLQSSIDAMKEMGPGVGPWRIIYCNGEKVIFHNYAHIVACDISEKNKGIYSIIELKDLKLAGGYQGSEIDMIYSSPDAMACVIGSGCWEQDIKSTKSLYICNLYNGSVKELEANYNMANDKVTWYRSMLSSTLLPWYVSIKDNDNTIIWDVEKTKKLDNIPKGVSLEPMEEKYIEDSDYDTGYSYYYWWKINENTIIGTPYKKGATSALQLKLSDFEIIEVNLKDKSGKILYWIN